MAISKVIYKESANATPVTWMDATTATAAAADIMAPKTAMLADGVMTTGTGSGGGGITPADPKDVNFIDYDGTIVYSYTKAEFAQLAALPANPSHTGLTAQGWNWTLSDAKTYVASYGKLWIGQMYVTTSGKTEIDIELGDAGLLSPYLKIAVNGTVTIDWGDGSTADTVTGTSLITAVYTPHTYATTGNYTISIGVTSGSFTFYNTYILSHTTSTANTSRRYNSSVIAVRLGSGITSIGSSAFQYCYSLQSVTIPSTVTSIGGSAFEYCYLLQSVTIPSGVTSIESYAFEYCYSLQSVTIPSTVTSIGSSAFYNCYSLQSVTIPSTVTSLGTYAFGSCTSLQSVTIPSGVTSLGTYAFTSCTSLQSVTIPSTVTSIWNNTFYSCTSLQSVTIPSTVTSIGGSAFYSCYSLQSVTIPSGVTSIESSAFYRGYSLYKLTFKPTTPPTVSASSAWTNLPTDCIIYVPYSADHSVLAAYTSANNYPSSSTYTYVEET